MAWVNKWKGKHVIIDPENPSALGECDDSGFTFNHKDLCKQMQWRGDSLVWTGLMVGKPYLDTPNEQDRPPLTKADPKAIINPRPSSPYLDPEYPAAGSYKRIEKQLEEESFHDSDSPPNVNNSGWVDPNPVPDYTIVINQLRKVSFQ